jgi:hypothetical protein
MSRLLARFSILIILTAMALIGCRQPVGSIDTGTGDGGKGTGDLNYLLVLPTRQLYETEERFERDNDLQILVAEDGIIKEIPPDDSSIKIEIIENPGLASESITVVNTMYYPFSLPGRHLVQVTYNEKFTRNYSIEVRGTFTGGGDGSDFMDIIWL